MLNTHRSAGPARFERQSAGRRRDIGQDSLLPVVPMFHVNAWGRRLSPPWSGAAGAAGPHLDGDSLLQLLAAEKVTVGFGVPVIWASFAGGDASDRRPRMPEFKRALVGGSALPPSMAEAFQRDYGIALTHARE